MRRAPAPGTAGFGALSTALAAAVTGASAAALTSALTAALARATPLRAAAFTRDGAGDFAEAAFGAAGAGDEADGGGGTGDGVGVEVFGVLVGRDTRPLVPFDFIT